MAAALASAALLYWLSVDFHAEGILALLQEALAALYVLPYLSGAVLGGNAHNPNGVVFFIALTVEFYAVIVLVTLAVRKVQAVRK